MASPFLHFKERKLSALEAKYLKWVLDGRFIIPGMGIPLLITLVSLPFLGLWPVQMMIEEEILPRGLSTTTSAIVLLIGVAGYVLCLLYAWTSFQRRFGADRKELARHEPVWPNSLTSLIALRSNRDEASQAIALADLAGSAFIRGWAIVKACARLMPMDDVAWRRKVFRNAAIAYSLLYGLSFIYIALVAPGFPSEIVREFGDSSEFARLSSWLHLFSWPPWLLLLALEVLSGTMSLVALVIFVAFWPVQLTSLIVVGSQVFLGLAFGRDTYSLAIATEISAEANPPRPPAILEHVDSGGLNSRHGVHAIPAARKRLAAWIRERVGELERK